MSTSLPPSTMFRSLLSEGWFVSVVETYEDRVNVMCHIYSRDYDDETGYTDILLGDPSSEPPDTTGLSCAAKFQGVFELREEGPAMLLHQPPLPSSGYKEMPRDMANAIAALITPANFPEAAEFMPDEEHTVYPHEEDARMSFWASVNEQISSMRAAGDPWGALRVQREAVDKVINWVDPPVEEEDEFLPEGAHLLPQDFQDFLRSWNQTIAASTGDWIGEGRQRFKLENPDLWKTFRTEMKGFNTLYAADVEALKVYQASSE